MKIDLLKKLKSPKWICIIISFIAVVSAVIYPIAYNNAISNFNKKIAEINERQAMYSKLNLIDQSIRQDYIGIIDENLLQESLCVGYTNGLTDSYSMYMNSEVYKKYLAIESKKAYKTGATIIKNRKNQLEIVDIIEGSPAQSSGLQRGDILMMISNIDVEKMKYEEVLIRLSGSAGETIDIQVFRKNVDNNSGELVKLSVTCGKYNEDSLSHCLLENSVGYISIYDFNCEILEKFKNSVEQLKESGATTYIIDLRNNFSGKIEYGAKILDYLLPAGNLVSTIDKKGNKQVLYVSGPESFESKYILLTNENTSQTGEIFASAVKDFKVATIIGENTRGRTTKNSVVPLSDGSALMVPVAHYITLNENILTGLSVSPDIFVDMSISNQDLLNKKMLNVENDNQLQEALKLLLGDYYKN